MKAGGRAFHPTRLCLWVSRLFAPYNRRLEPRWVVNPRFSPVDLVVLGSSFHLDHSPLLSLPVTFWAVSRWALPRFIISLHFLRLYFRHPSFHIRWSDLAESLHLRKLLSWITPRQHFIYPLIIINDYMILFKHNLQLSLTMFRFTCHLVCVEPL